MGGLGLLTGIGATMAGYAIFKEPFKISLDRLAIKVNGAKGRLPAKGLRILHLSDTHFQGLMWRERPKIEQIQRLAASVDYDLLIHTGDFWHNEAGEENLLTLLEGMRKPRFGAYGVLGNHDYACYSHGDALARNWQKFQEVQNGANASGRENGQHNQEPVAQFVKREPQSPVTFTREAARFVQYFLTTPFELERTSYNDTTRLEQILGHCGFTLLHNQAIHLQENVGQPDGVDCYLAGIDDWTEGSPHIEDAFDEIPADAISVLLSHNPDILEDTLSRRADLILSGHTHGGQINLPWIGAVHTHSAHLGRKEAAGYLQRDGTQVYITRGVGEGIPMRFGAKPQITLITMTGSES